MRRPFHLLIALFAALALVATACGNDDAETSSTTETTGSASEPAPDPIEGPEIVVAAQDFGESKVLAQIYAQALSRAGYTTSVQELAGFRDILQGAFESGDVHLSAEYVGSLLEFLNGPDVDEASSDADASAELLTGYLADVGLLNLDFAPGANSNAFAMTRARSDELGITRLSELTDDLTLGAPSDCETNAGCIPGLQSVYDVDLSDGFTPLDAGRPDALEAGEIDVAVLFSTDGVISAKDFVLLEDDLGMFNAENIVPVIAQSTIDAYDSDLTDLINSVTALLDTETLIALNEQFDIDKVDADVIASDWLDANGF